jgi:predicted lipid-binding transport protein (Tim44 family)
MSLYALEILLLALIAGFLGYRLWLVLGRRTGVEQRRPNPFSPPPADAPVRDNGGRDNVVTMPTRDTAPQDDAASAEPPPLPQGMQGVAAGLTQIRIADRSFDEKGFLEGAKSAFKMIVEAFAHGATQTLRPLLADDLYDEFSRAIRARIAAKRTLEQTVQSLEDAEIVGARMEGRTALVTVRFVSRQTNVSREADGTVIDGAPDRVVEAIDIWTFARNTRSTDPNWQLVETRTPD